MTDCELVMIAVPKLVESESGLTVLKKSEIYLF